MSDWHRQLIHGATPGSVTSDVGYAGYFNHASSGLQFALYRAYDPTHVRWLNRDPIAEAGRINLYAYVDGNPVSFKDPLGLFNPVKGSVAAANGWRGGSNVTKGALMLLVGEELGPADYALALWKIKFGWASIKRGAQQWQRG